MGFFEETCELRGLCHLNFESRSGTLEGRQGRKPLLNHKIYLSPERSERAAETGAYNYDDFQLATLTCE